LITIYVSSYAIAIYIKTTLNLSSVFKNLLIINFLLTIVAVISYFTDFANYFWWQMNYTTAYNELLRLKMLVSEPSLYATFILPLFAFYFLSFFKLKTHKNLIYLILILIPLLLTYSLGVISGFIIALCLTFLIQVFRHFISVRFLNMYLYLSLLCLTLILLLAILYPDNPIFVRISMVLNNQDTSSNGRTTDAFYIAYEIAKMKSLIWGVGLGQVKLIGHDFIINFYNYTDTSMTVRIPNVVADTFATFGIVGIIIRFGAIFYLFFKTKVLTNYYRTLLFFFIFVYQFTGSYYHNLAEYTIWILAFSNSFPQFNLNNKFSKNENSFSV